MDNLMPAFDTINISVYNEEYDNLVKLIDDIVLQTQDIEGRILPNIMKLTKKQHKMLRRYPQCKAMFGTTQKYWLTPYNLMECVVI